MLIAHVTIHFIIELVVTADVLTMDVYDGCLLPRTCQRAAVDEAEMQHSSTPIVGILAVT